MRSKPGQSRPGPKLFTYGSLMYADIFTAVSGEHCPARTARLAGFRRCRVKGQAYPGIRPDAQGEVAGVLYEGVGDTAMTRLDEFEGVEYLRERLAVVGEDGVVTEAECYVFRPECYSRLLPDDWDVQEFEQVGKARFIRTFFANWQSRQ